MEIFELICAQDIRIYNLLAQTNSQNDGEIESFEVHTLNNGNKEITNIWSLLTPGTSGWKEGKVEVISVEYEYQVMLT